MVEDPVLLAPKKIPIVLRSLKEENVCYGVQKSEKQKKMVECTVRRMTLGCCATSLLPRSNLKTAH